ncbi:hypothetical protein JCM3766R1_005146 [Sporobolomyces carnicolor]
MTDHAQPAGSTSQRDQADDVTDERHAPMMPTHLAQRLQHEQEQFEKRLNPAQLEASLASATERHDQVIHEKQMASHDQVEHAKEVAASHESRPEDNVPGRVLHSADEKLLAPLESAVEEKKASLSEQQRELERLDERLKELEARQDEMKAQLGLLR